MLVPEANSFVSIIILNFNGASVLKNCLQSLEKTNCNNFEVIVVDNGSTDNSVEVIHDYASRENLNIVLVKNERNLGFAKGNNIGVERSVGKYIVFLNNDTTVSPNWLNSMVKILENNVEVASVQSLLMNGDGSKVDSMGGVIDFLGTAWDEVLHFDKLEKNVGNYYEIFAACGAAMLIRKDVFEAVGKFDNAFFAFYEDVDLSWRVRLNGYKIVLDTDSIVFHLRSSTSKRFGRQLFEYHLYKNQIAMLLKNYSLKNVAKATPLVAILYLIRLFNGIARSDAYLSMATLKAVYWNLKSFTYVWSQRMYVQTCVRRIEDKQIEKMINKKPIQISRKK